MSVTNKHLKKYSQYDWPLPFDPTVGVDAFGPVDPAPEIQDFDDEFKEANCYNRNPKLLRNNVHLPYTEEMEDELIKCDENVFYFIMNYCKVVTLDHGTQLFKLYQFQKNMIKIMHENRFSIFKLPRQSGKCSDGKTELDITINGNHTKINFEQLYDLIETENKVDDYIPNTDYEILTDAGFKDFDGLTQSTSDHIIKITLEDDSIIETTPLHEIYYSKNEKKPAIDFEQNDKLFTIKGQIGIKDIEFINEKHTVVDFINVQDVHTFMINNIKVSNCVDGQTISRFKNMETCEVLEMTMEQATEYLKQWNSSRSLTSEYNLT